MRLGITALFVLCMISALFAAGCADVTTAQKVGDFGTVFGASSEEQKAIDWFKSTYGDPTTNAGQPARFIEPMVTTGLSDKNLPVNKVTTFPASGGSVYFFVIYDNFVKGDQITVTWTYIENGKEVTRLQKEAGGDFGRFIVEFQKPDTGWGKGRQRITISGKGASANVEFTIGDTLVTTPLPYNPSEGQGSPVPTSQTPVSATGTVTLPATPVTTVTTSQPTPATSCVRGQQLCGGTCRDIMNDISNCGSCGNACPAPDAGTLRSCSGGQCSATCIPHYADCDGNSLNGCEINTFTDPNNCGYCHNVCPSAMGTAQCDSGTCKITCNPGFANCNGGVSDGCETNIKFDANNCGSCGNKCPSIGGAAPRCEGNQCV